MTIRRGDEADFRAVAEIDSSFSNEWLLELRRMNDPIEQTIDLRWRKVRPGGSTRDFAVNKAALREELQACDRWVVAEARNHVAGYLALKKNWNQTAELGAIIVDAAFRGRGIGRRFIREAETFARRRGLRALQWEAQNDNRQALEFAVSQGFRIAGFHDAVYRNRGHDQQRAAGFRGIAVFLVRELT